MALLQVKNLHKKFRLGKTEFTAVNDVSFQIEKGKTFGLVGESGCGKSTIALSVMALQTVNSGKVLFNGQDILELSKIKLRPLRRNIRMLFQNPEAVLNSGMTLKQVLLEELEKEPELSKAEKALRITETIEQVGLREEHLKRYPPGLSTGEKQRAAIARAVITRPKFLLCDEPVASLDLSLKATIIDLLMDLQEKRELTYLYISHNLSLVRKISHQIGVMYMGYLVEEAPAEKFSVQDVLHPYSRLLLASVPSTDPDAFSKILSEYPDVEPTRFEKGCPFRNRCPLYKENPLKDCEEKQPVLITRDDGRKVACYQVD